MEFLHQYLIHSVHVFLLLCSVPLFPFLLVLAMEEDRESNLIVIASAYGVSVWRAYRAISLEMSHVMEKMYTFSLCPGWISKVRAYTYAHPHPLTLAHSHTH